MFDNEVQMTENMGGEVGRIVAEIRKAVSISCHGICFDETATNDIRGYPHEGGIADSSGKRWWVYVHCSNPVKRAGKRATCDYDTSWGKIMSRLGRKE